MTCKDCIHNRACVHADEAARHPEHYRQTNYETGYCADWEGVTPLTNRAWLSKLSDKQLAAFLTTGLPGVLVEWQLCYGSISINQILRRNIDSVEAVYNWLKEDQEFEVL